MIKEGKELSANNKRIVLNLIMGVSVSLFLIFTFLIISEIYSAKKGCEEMGGIYEYKVVNHLCDGEQFYEYTDGSWNWEIKPLTFDEIIFLP